MNTKSNKIKCPSCGAQIDVDEVLSHQLEDELEKKYNRKLVSEREKLKKAVEKGIQEKIAKIEENSKKKAKEEQAEEVKALEKELKEKSDQVKELNKSKAEIGRLKREKDELRGKITSELEQQLSETLAEKETEKKQFEDKLRKKYNHQLASEQEKLREEKETVEKQKLEFDANVKKAVKQGIQEKTANLEESLKKKAKEEQAEEVKALEKELKEKSDQVKELNKSKAEIGRLKREKDELQDKITFEKEQEHRQKLNEEKAKIKQFEEEKAKRKITEAELKITERDEFIDQLKDDLKKAEQKANQVPAPLKGEAQELAIEEWLKDQFPLDAIEEIKKGARGADCLQTVKNPSGKNCGTIYYESKRTGSFRKDWIDKFNADIREKKADIGVLVTQAMPKGMERFGPKDGIWICSFDEFKGLCHVFRAHLIEMSKAVVAQKNKGDKMAMLYDYLTSNEFRSYAEAIVQSFVQMKKGLDAEKRATERRWKQQEKQIEIGLGGIAGMVGAIEGIAGNAIQPPASLELPSGDKEYDNDD